MLVHRYVNIKHDGNIVVMLTLYYSQQLYMLTCYTTYALMVYHIAIDIAYS